MIRTVIRRNAYQDSITLMLLSGSIAKLPEVTKVSVMMGTGANKEILTAAGLATDEFDKAGANDIIVAMDIESEAAVEGVLKGIDDFLSRQGEKAESDEGRTAVQSWEEALSARPDANLVLLSIPGAYVELEAEAALDAGKHVFIFSDNVPIEAERKLKEKAGAKGLLVMGPDCGTALIGGVPLAFTNVIPRGNIGIVGASGTGIQEISTQIARLGCGVSHAIGTGGRDIKEEIGAATMTAGIAALEADSGTDCIVVVCKPPAETVKRKLLALLRGTSKPACAIFIGETFAADEEGLRFADTLEQAARIAVELCGEAAVPPTGGPYSPGIVPHSAKPATGRGICGLYTGGTLAAEAAVMIERALGVAGDHLGHKDGFMLHRSGHTVVDLGDDVYTQGKPHPMIDPQTRLDFLRKTGEDESVGVILLDFVLGYGAHADIAGVTAPVIREVGERARKSGRELHFVACICGSQGDPQGIAAQKRSLIEAGVIVADSNASAVATALSLIGLKVSYPAKTLERKAGRAETVPVVAEPVRRLLSGPLAAINVGLKSFTEPLQALRIPHVQYDWKPSAGGDVRLQKMLAFLARAETAGRSVDAANGEVIAKITAAAPFLMDVVPAKSVIPELEKGKTLLHSGPPILWKNMTSPMRGSCVGAVLFEGWAGDEAAARAMLEGGEIAFLPCHHVGAVGPMGGITSANMPVMVVLNKTDGNRAFCTMNEGIGAVLRFGAYGPPVIERLRWMRDVLAPTLSAVLRGIEGGLNVNVLVTKAIAMGDEFHQRNIAGSLCFLKEIAPRLTLAPIPEGHRAEVMRFLADTDQFFLNIMMAAAKAVMDAARTVEIGTVVTAMTRNGENFGIRISGMGETWFTAPVNTPDGLYFTGYSSGDASPDMGDSAITETFGVGGMAMIAAPAVTRFVGSGGFGDALRTSDQMMRICMGRNPAFPVPTWDFKGICLGIDARKVVATGITPVINTGIAHREAGIGQIGAGTVRPPLACFEQAVRAYAEKLGFRD